MERRSRLQRTWEVQLHLSTYISTGLMVHINERGAIAQVLVLLALNTPLLEMERATGQVIPSS